MVTEKTHYILRYDTEKQLTSNDFDNAIISFSTKNDMADDSPVFSLVVLGKEKWDKKLGSNDLIRIQVIPDTRKEVPENPYVMVGLISDVHKEGEYSEGSLLYRITGRAMSKSLIDFEVGVIQEVATVISDIGWLPDGTENGLNFSGNTASGIAKELMERFVYKYAEYNFEDGKVLRDYFDYNFTSWVEDESLADVTPFINYQGSLRQFLEDVTAKPFNELYFEFTKDGKCTALMRPTPFDADKWAQLPTYRITSDVVAEESFGKSDSEMYSIYIVQPPNIMEFNSMDLGVFPQYHPDLIKKYGYKRLDAQNRYLLSGAILDAYDPDEETEDNQAEVAPEVNPETEYPTFNEVWGFITSMRYEEVHVAQMFAVVIKEDLAKTFPTLEGFMISDIVDNLLAGDFSEEKYIATASKGAGVIKEESSSSGTGTIIHFGPPFEEVLTFITNNEYHDPETLRTSRKTVYNDLIQNFPSITESLANTIIDLLVAGDFTREEYNKVKDSTGDSERDREINHEKNIAGDKLKEYTKRLYNWYCENANFYSGDIRVIGHPMYRVGARLFYEDFEQDTTWEFYIECVEHEFSFTNGYMTILGVTRGLPESGRKRYSNLWGKAEDFKGGYLGELSLEDLLDQAQTAPSVGDEVLDWDNSIQGGPVATAALKVAQEMSNYDSYYQWGGGRDGKNPFLKRPIGVDCSSFVWWCYYESGVSLSGGKTGMTTDTIKRDPRLSKIQGWGTDKKSALSKLQAGDIVYFDTYKVDGHVGIYVGNGKFIGSQSSTGIEVADMSKGYWWDTFKGHIYRYTDISVGDGVRV